MTIPYENALLQAEYIEPTLVAHITQDPIDLQQAFALRHRVFSDAMGIHITSTEFGIDRDHFDKVCLHLIVKDVENDRVVGYSRILTNDLAAQAGGFYSATEFDISDIIIPGKQYMEIGRTCVDPNFRSGAVIGMLWGAITQYMTANEIDYLMGCASIPLSDGYEKVNAVTNYLRDNHFTDTNMRAIPLNPLPHVDTELNGKTLIPPLLRAYLRIGLKVCGELSIDEQFNVADALIVMASGDMNKRYLRHFTRTEV